MDSKRLSKGVIVMDLSCSDAKREHSRLYGTPDFPGGIPGDRTVLDLGDEAYPSSLANIPDPPKRLYVLGNPNALEEGLAVIGARRATPYGLLCARTFAGIAASRGIPIVSGGALGCDSAAHKAALDAGGRTVVVLGGGCDALYPRRNAGLFEEVVRSGGALVSEHEWDFPPLPYTFRARNRLIAGLAKATLIVEAGVPSGTFSTADDALSANREVLVVPGSISSPQSRGSNHLICQGATPIVDRETFDDALFSLFGCLRTQAIESTGQRSDSLYDALCADSMSIEELVKAGFGAREGASAPAWVSARLSRLQSEGRIVRHPDGRYGPASLGL